jgi:reductive dehalogenase
MAVDAGLGEVGRIGYLITKEFGPRLRLAAVTTDLPLVPDEPVDIGVEDFCGLCKKCAVCCPSQSIPAGDMAEVNGSLRWKLDEATCFDYWAKVGTDCGVCMRVCPWSHARSFPHRMIVWMVARNRTARRLFLVLDDIFYGNRPKPKVPPSWAGFSG